MNPKPLWISYGNSTIEHHRITQPANNLNHPSITYTPNHGYTNTNHNHPLNPNYTPTHTITQNPTNNANQTLINQLPPTTIHIPNLDDYNPGLQHIPDPPIKPTKQHINNWWNNIHNAPHILVSTPQLAKLINHPNTHITPNYLNPKHYPPPNHHNPNNPTIRIGWAGGTGHQQSLQPLTEPILDLLNHNPNLQYHHHGPNNPIKHPNSHTHPWTNRLLHHHQLNQTTDILLLPHTNTPYHNAKSQLRLYTATQLGKTTIGNTTHYNQNPHTTPAHTPTQYHTTIQHYINNPHKIQETQKQNHQWANNNLHWKHNKHHWQNALNTILNTQP